MSDHHVQLLALGAAFGSNLTVLLLIALEYVSDRRAMRRARSRKVKETRADLRTSEPHPAEVLEASVRDFELNLLNCFDRVDDVLRRDGLL